MFARSGYVVGALLALALLAFWPSYVAKLPGDFDRYTHLHVVVMLAWFGLLFAQPLLIRTGRRAVHRALGRASYALVVGIVGTTLLLTHVRMAAMPPEQLDDVAHFFVLPFSMMALFVFAYALAIVHRDTIALHARYMLGTCVALVDPVVGRIVVRIDPHISDDRYPALASYAVVASVLVLLIVLERNARSGRRAFPILLAAATVAWAGFFTWARTASWQDFVRWFAGLPLT